MIRKVILVGALFFAGFLFGNLVKAADVNGYTALYECRAKTVGEAGYANCNVDVATYTAAACQQIIHTSDAWSTINWAADVICLEVGDHTAKGVLTVGSSGTSGTRKVIRYYRASDSDDDPWDQTSGNQAKVKGIDFDGRDYWIVHRITFGGTSTSAYSTDWGIDFYQGSDYNIVNRSLVQYIDNNLVVSYGDTPKGNYNTVQNSVIRSAKAVLSTGAGSVGAENQCVEFNVASFFRLVNNEIYDCNKMFSAGDAIEGETPGTVIENNDLYVSSAYYTDCAGNYNSSGPCAVSEVVSVLKTAGTQANPVQILHNRFWGGKTGDGVILGGNGLGGGGCLNISANPGQGVASWVLVKNNICSDSVYAWDGYWGIDHHISWIGNLAYDLHSENGDYDYLVAGFEYSAKQYTEAYLNTFIYIHGPTNPWMNINGSTYPGGPDANNDTRCNVIIDAGVATGTLGSGSQRDYTTYYGTADSGETNKLGNYALNTRANSTAYSLGAVIRTSATPTDCTGATDTDCFLYKVTSAGTSAGSNPGYCTTLGCTTTDGTMVVKAIRGPYSYWRKLRTTAEQAFIPYAKVHNSAPEYGYCPNTTGNRTGIGINDQTGTW